MLIKRLRQIGLTSDMAYLASAASIALSIASWYMEKDKDTGHGERFGIFVGLWAPTFAVLGNALQKHEDDEANLKPGEAA
ncbi:MAG: hypothetical protein OHK0029_03600 [Armatimonadaceae bacterium]